MPPEDSLYLFSAPFYYGFTNSRLQVRAYYILNYQKLFERYTLVGQICTKHTFLIVSVLPLGIPSVGVQTRLTL